MINLSPPRFVSRIFSTPTWHVPNEENRIFLTFDDGPTPGVTEWVLDELSIRDAKASFFCLGRNAERYPDLLARIREEGHTVGNHTYSHLRGYRESLRDYYNDILEANRLLTTDLFRPPYGRITPKQLSFIAQHFRVVLWSVLSMDYSRHISPHRCLDIVQQNARVGDIVVFHDSCKAQRNLRYALPRALDRLQERGLKLSALGQAEFMPEAEEESATQQLALGVKPLPSNS
ncbi:MAG: polysaccharide deacetylase family protein [Bacteroidetes bacterium]|nr:MAG: polysaccharide deacetylase family protein [Bacteroidota bacterium]